VTTPPFNLTIVRYVTAAALGLVAAVLALVVVLAVLRGESLTSQQIVSLLGLVAVLVGIIANVLATRQVASAVQQVQAVAQDVQDKVNGHLEAHLGTTDARVAELVDKRLQEQGAVPPPPAPGG
jgi:flagellar motor component MotA